MGIGVLDIINIEQVIPTQLLANVRDGLERPVIAFKHLLKPVEMAPNAAGSADTS
jgi:hypothetical protein